MRRLLALVAAAAMVAGSLFLRSRLDRKHEEAANPVRLVCAAELGSTCDAVASLVPGTTTEPSVATADRLASTDDPQVDAWLVAGPWPQIVDGRRRARGLEPIFTDLGNPLARSPLVLVGWNDRTPPCGLQWKCIGETKDTRPGHGNLATDGLATLVLGQAAEDFFGRSDLSTVDLDDGPFQGWLTNLERAVPAAPSTGSPLAQMLVTRRAVYDMVGTVEAEAGPVLQRAAIGNEAKLAYPSPMVTADVVLATTGGDKGRRAREAAGGEATRKALGEAGWRVGGGGNPPLPPASGLPSPGFLDALRARALQAAGR